MMRSSALKLVALLSGLATAASRADDMLTVFFNERPPYLVANADGTPTGLTGSPAVRAFKAAQVPVRWAVLPTNRQVAMIREGAGRYCAVGWFKSAEREQFAKFSKPLYRDRRWLALTSPGFAADEAQSLESALRQPGTRVLVKDKYSYGAHIDALLQTVKPTIAVSTGTTVQMLQSLSANAVDLMFVSEEEGQYLMASLGPAKRLRLRLLRFVDMPQGETRHLMCSLAVPDELMDRVNKVIHFK